MSYIKCTSCGKQTYKDFSNPNIHYSVSENDISNFKCHHCLNFESLKVGEWYQNEKGEYFQKEAQTEISSEQQLCVNCKNFPCDNFEKHLKCKKCVHIDNLQSNFESK